jgi:hypothetical protein
VSGGLDNVRRLRDSTEDEPPSDGGSVDTDECPVTVLGRAAGVYYFIAASGELMEIAAREMTPRVINSVFDGRLRWLIDNFPAVDKAGDPTGGVNYNSAAAGLMRMAADRPIWDRETPIRGRGVWRSGDKVIVHCGDGVLVGRDWQRPGLMMGAAVYPAYAAIRRPAERAATAADGARLLQAFGLWNYQRPVMGHLSLGWCSLAMLGAAPRWRAHFLATGDRGCGKSALMNLFGAALGPQSYALNDFTPASIQQTLNGQGRALLLDEAEDDGSLGRVQQVIELLRKMSGGDGAVGARGSSGGQARSFVVNATTALGAINPPQLLPQDRSRILVCELGKIVDTSNEAKVLSETLWAEQMSPRLRARMLRGWSRFGQALEFWRAELLQTFCDNRQADQIGCLLAAADIMLNDAPPDADSTRVLIEALTPVLVAMFHADSEQTDPQLCLNRLFSRQIEAWDKGSKETVGAVVEKALTNDFPETAEKALRRNGMRLEAHNGEWVLLVAHIHNGMAEIFRASRWRDGGWNSALSRIERTFPWPKPEKFAGAQSRAIAIPMEYLPLPEDKILRSVPPARPPDTGGA